MPNDSMIPRPSSLRDIRRNQEDEERKREQQTNSRKSDNTTVSSGGKFDVDGNFNVRNGGIGTIELGGKMNVQGSLDITDGGEATVTGQGPDWYDGDTIPIVTCLGNRTAWNPWVGYNYTQPGVYFTKGESLGALDPRVISEGDGAVEVISASEPLENGPQVGPNIKSDSSMAIRPWSASIGSGSWDQSVNYEGREGLEGLRGSSYGYFTPSEFSIGLDNYEYLGAIPQGPVASIRASLEDRVLRLQGMDGVDIKGPLTVDGAPVGGGTWDSITGKPTTFPPSSHSHSTSQVTGLDTALAGKAPTNHSHSISQVTNLQTTLDAKAAATHGHAAATTIAAGFMSAADKTKLDGVPAGSTALSYYVATGTKANFDAANQTIATPAYQAAGSTANLAVPGNSQLTITEAGIYSITFSFTLYTDGTLTVVKPASGRSFIDINDAAGEAYSRTAIPVGEDKATGNHAGIFLPAGAVLKFGVIQTSGGTAGYRARIWITKHP